MGRQEREQLRLIGGKSHLLIISAVPHHRVAAGLVGWGPTIREIDSLTPMFHKVTHIGMECDGPPPANFLPYESHNVEVELLPRVGGTTFLAKLGVFARIPAFWATIKGALGGADVVHLRCPANIPFVGLLVLWFSGFKGVVWAKYAGNWGGYRGEPWSYRIQRWLLSREKPNLIVTVNGRWTGQRRHVHTVENPSFSEAEVVKSNKLSAEKVIGRPLRLLFVGAATEGKGILQTVDLAVRLRDEGVDFLFDVAGDGPTLLRARTLAAQKGLGDRVIFHGWQSGEALDGLFSQAHFVVLPSRSEGWPKVLSEGMAYGAVPVASAVGSIPYYLNEFQAGRAVSPGSVDEMCTAIQEYLKAPAMWAEEAVRCREFAHRFTFDTYVAAISDLLQIESL